MLLINSDLSTNSIDNPWYNFGFKKNSTEIHNTTKLNYHKIQQGMHDIKIWIWINFNGDTTIKIELRLN